MDEQCELDSYADAAYFVHKMELFHFSVLALLLPFLRLQACPIGDEIHDAFVCFQHAFFVG